MGKHFQYFTEHTMVTLLEVCFNGAKPIEHQGWAEFNPVVGKPFVLDLGEGAGKFETMSVATIISSSIDRVIFNAGETTYELIFPVRTST